MRKSHKTEIDPFPLSQSRFLDGTRRMAREKVVQMLSAFDEADSDRNAVFDHIFFREFNLGEGEQEQHGRPLRAAEVEEMEADTPINWRDKDVNFARNLFVTTLGDVAALDERIERLAKNWDLERIALIDRQLLRMAITEMKTCSDIVPRITINEAIELAKTYSTEKSSVFINGILDAARDELIAEGMLASVDIAEANPDKVKDVTVDANGAEDSGSLSDAVNEEVSATSADETPVNLSVAGS